MGKHARKRPNRTRIAVVATASAAAVTATIACTVLPGTPEADTQNASAASDAALGSDLVPANHVMSQQVAIARQNVQTAEDEARSKARAAARSQAEGRAKAEATRKAEAIRKAEAARKAEARSKIEARQRAEEAAQRAARSQPTRTPASATPSASASASATPSAGTYSDDLDGWIKEALAVMTAHNIPGTYDGIYRNIIRESSGNPQAINLTDSNAAAGIPSKGLLQVIDPTFQQYHVEGTSMDIYDPVANITAACNYAAANYGSIDNVDSAY
ncbi:transglycosylase SLT domain-containing protein [Streptomyces sp. H39-S7]|uniref:transglycosylase SLT domain-containing protein n=1 Tax=Streptomyces sp. H39-S7 TaxID=3004357 RepID=UPI0022AEAD4B|nr:transglycosylase SLT domain-containing protein [Streptomyces sp. H39-S7]MCZ4119952.1 transglycosylase SLT domain-containing protein [Streptomyces sp. H39-S7]